MKEKNEGLLIIKSCLDLLRPCCWQKRGFFFSFFFNDYKSRFKINPN